MSSAPRRPSPGAAAAGIALAACLLAAPLRGEPRAGARELALEGRRLLEAGELAGAKDRLTAARAALGAEAARQPDLTDHLATSLFNLGVRLNNAADPDGALEAFLQLLEIAPSAPKYREREFRSRCREATLGVAAWLVSAGRPRRAEEACARLMALDPEDLQAPLGLGEAALAAGEPERAMEAFRRAGDLAPDRSEPRAGEGRAALALGARMESRPGDAAAREALDSLYEQAVRHLEAARDRASGSEAIGRDLAKARLALARVRVRGGEIAGAAELTGAAEAELRKLMATFRESPWPALDLASLRFRQGEFGEAAELFGRGAGQLEAHLAAAPSDANAGTWRQAAASARESAAAAAYNLAVDALNEARFDEAERHLGSACPDPARQDLCARFREAAATRRASFEGAVAALQSALSREPTRAASRLELGDLFARVGWYDRAREEYLKLGPGEGEPVAGLADRLAAVAPIPDVRLRSERLDLTGGRVILLHPGDRPDPELITAIRASWLRVTASVGEAAMRGPLTLVVYPNQRAFRERAGPRLGGLVKGNYGDGRISVYSSPSQGAVEWVSVLTHEMTHHAIERLSGGACPRWLSEGLARYVEGDSSVLDRERVRQRLRAREIPPLKDLDARMERSWNDPAAYLDWRDAALLAVEDLARRGGMPAMLEALRRLKEGGGAAGGERLDSALGRPLEAIDASWREALGTASGGN